MGLAVVTVASGGMPVVDVTGIAPRTGLPVTEAANGYGVPVTKVTGGKPGLPVVFETIGVVAPVTYATLDAATVTAVTLSGGGLVATNTGTTSVNQGARVANAGGKTSGKYYFESTFTVLSGTVPSSQQSYGVGVGTIASTFTGMGTNAATGAHMFRSAQIYANGVNSSINVGAAAVQPNAVIGVAVDLDNRKIWFRAQPSGSDWNGNVANNPETNVGGVTVPAGTMVPFVTFGGVNGTANNVQTLNLGASAFVGAVPAGFTSGWPA